MKRSRFAVVADRLKLVFGLSAMAGMAYVFTFYLDADIGVVICAFLLLAPLISALLSWYASRHITVSLESPSCLAKGRHFAVKTQITATGKLPVPFLRCQIGQDANFTPEDGRIVQCAMTPAEPLVIESGMTAEYAGCGLIFLENLRVSDYLGLFSFAVKNNAETLKVGVIPAIPSLSGAAKMLHTVSDVVLTQDDEEEESAAAFSSQTMPGYIHRDYVPGDNLKRINYKLSAKRGKLMVRMDEAAATVRPTVVLDLQPEVTAELLRKRQTLIEGALGFLLLLVRQGIVCSLRYAADGVWHCLYLESEDAVRMAAVELAAADFRNDGNRIDLSADQERAGAFLVYTSRPDELLSARLVSLRNAGYVCCVCPSGSDTQALTADALWLLSEDFSMTAVQK